MVKMFKNDIILRSYTLIAIATLLMGMTINDPRSLHDPTEPPAELIPAKVNEISYRSMNLSAVFIKPNEQWAIINGQTYHEGDAIGEYIITNIEIDAVELIDSANNRETLRLVAPIKKATQS